MAWQVENESNSNNGSTSRYINAYDYGLRTTNTAEQNRTAILLAISSAQALDIATIYIDSGTFAMNPFEKPTNIELIGAGQYTTILDFSNATQQSVNDNNYAVIASIGTLVEVGALSTVQKDSSSINISAGAQTFTPGSIGIIYNDTDFSYNPARFYYRAGEFFRATGNDGATEVTLDNQLYAGYAAGANIHVYKLDMVRGSIKSLSVIGPGSAFESNGIYIRHGQGYVVRDVYVEGCTAGGIVLDRCFDMYIDSVRTFDISSAIGSNYGLAILCSQKIVVNNCILHATRHGLTIGGGTTTAGLAYTGGVVNRDLLIDGCIISTDPEGLVSAADMHGNVEYVTYRACAMRGAHIAGDHTALIGCTSFAATNNGEAIHATELVGFDHKIEGCTLWATKNVNGSYGLLNVTEVLNTITKLTGTLRIANNKIEMGDYTGNVIYVYNNDSVDSPDSLSVEVIDNTLSYTGVKSTASLVQIRADSGKGFYSVTLKDNKSSGVSLRTDGVNATHVNISNNILLDCSGSGAIEILPNPEPLAFTLLEKERIIVNDNTILRANACGALILGMQDEVNLNIANCVFRDNIILDCVQGGFTGSSSTSSAAYIANMNTLTFEDNTVGDTQTVRTQSRYYALENIYSRIENDNTILDSDPSDPLTSNYTNAGNKINRIVDQSLVAENWDAGPPVPTATPDWAQNTNYSIGDKVKNDGYVYVAIVGGLSAAAGTGPSTKGYSIADGTVFWDYAGENIGGYWWRGSIVFNCFSVDGSPLLFRKTSVGLESVGTWEHVYGLSENAKLDIDVKTNESIETYADAVKKTRNQTYSAQSTTGAAVSVQVATVANDTRTTLTIQCTAKKSDDSIACEQLVVARIKKPAGVAAIWGNGGQPTKSTLESDGVTTGAAFDVVFVGNQPFIQWTPPVSAGTYNVTFDVTESIVD